MHNSPHGPRPTCTEPQKRTHPNDTKHREDGTTLKVFGSAFFKKRRRKRCERKATQNKKAPRKRGNTDVGLFAVEVDFALFYLAVGLCEECDDGGDEVYHVFDGSGFALVALDAVEHCGVECSEAEFDVADTISCDNDAQSWEFLFEWGPEGAVGCPDGEFEQLEV